MIYIRISILTGRHSIAPGWPPSTSSASWTRHPSGRTWLRAWKWRRSPSSCCGPWMPGRLESDTLHRILQKTPTQRSTHTLYYYYIYIIFYNIYILCLYIILYHNILLYYIILLLLLLLLIYIYILYFILFYFIIYIIYYAYCIYYI